MKREFPSFKDKLGHPYLGNDTSYAKYPKEVLRNSI